MKKRVYVAGPITKPATVEGLHHNIRQADDAMASLMRLGFAVFNPMLSCFAGGIAMLHHNDESHGVIARANAQANNQFKEFTHQDWLDMDFAWIEVSHAVLRLPGESKGADMETAFANDRGIPVFHTIEELVRHFADHK